ncbi:glycosyltransferase family 4 protein [Bacteroides acidifaciens]|uniref:glycosyltransferase family 4 protein n=1 Tax=Bacteroides acidifaciens TaxID=85831 RepID=UPI002632F4D9|nr:glycosyltransferase family 4 protein [Bacteroides acidifaciens]
MDLRNVFVLNDCATSRRDLSYWYNTLNLYKFVRKGSFDIVHTDLQFAQDKRWIYNFGNFITTIHDPFPHSGEDWNYDGSKYSNAINLSKGLVLLNGIQKNEFCKRYGVHEDKLLINKLGIYDCLTHLMPIGNIEPLNNNVLFFGRIAPYKGLEYLCEAMRLVRMKISDATLTVAGGGNLYFDISSYKMGGYVDIHNHYVGVDELMKLLARTTVTVCPYTDATQSGVIMTSYSMGKPVIASDVGGLSEMIENGKTGMLVMPKNPQLLADAIVSLLSDRMKLKEMSNYIKQKFCVGENSWEAIADRYIQFYHKIKAC